MVLFYNHVSFLFCLKGWVGVEMDVQGAGVTLDKFAKAVNDE